MTKTEKAIYVWLNNLLSLYSWVEYLDKIYFIYDNNTEYGDIVVDLYRKIIVVHVSIIKKLRETFLIDEREIKLYISNWFRDSTGIEQQFEVYGGWNTSLSGLKLEYEVSLMVKNNKSN